MLENHTPSNQDEVVIDDEKQKIVEPEPTKALTLDDVIANLPEDQQQVIRNNTIPKPEFSRMRARDTEDIKLLKSRIAELETDADFRKKLVSDPQFAKEVIKTLNIQDDNILDKEIENQLSELPAQEVKIIRALATKVTQGIISPLQEKVNKLEALEAAKAINYNKKTLAIIQDKAKKAIGKNGDYKKVIDMMDIIANKFNLNLQAISKEDPILFREHCNNLFNIAISNKELTNSQADTILKMQEQQEKTISNASKNVRNTTSKEDAAPIVRTITDAFNLAIAQQRNKKT